MPNIICHTTLQRDDDRYGAVAWALVHNALVHHMLAGNLPANVGATEWAGNLAACYGNVGHGQEHMLLQVYRSAVEEHGRIKHADQDSMDIKLDIVRCRHAAMCAATTMETYINDPFGWENGYHEPTFELDDETDFDPPLWPQRYNDETGEYEDYDPVQEKYS